MKAAGTKLVTMVVVIGGGMLILRLVGPKLGERMERMFEDAPEDFPPKWMYVNITAIRRNTERILETLASEQAESAGSAA